MPAYAKNPRDIIVIALVSLIAIIAFKRVFTAIQGNEDNG